MKVTRVEITLPFKGPRGLLAYVTVEFDKCFVIHGMRLIDKTGGRNGWFVAMPSKKAGDRCPNCGAYNAFDAKFCEQCGTLCQNRPMLLTELGVRRHQDVAHPITTEFRRELEVAVFAAYDQALAGRERSAE